MSVRVWFASGDLQRTCSHRDQMRAAWGDAADLVALVLAQLRAMATIDDLDFLPFDSRRLPDDAIAIELDELVVVLVHDRDHPDQGDAPMDHLTVTEVSTAPDRTAAR